MDTGLPECLGLVADEDAHLGVIKQHEKTALDAQFRQLHPFAQEQPAQQSRDEGRAGLHQPEDLSGQGGIGNGVYRPRLTGPPSRPPAFAGSVDGVILAHDSPARGA